MMRTALLSAFHPRRIRRALALVNFHHEQHHIGHIPRMASSLITNSKQGERQARYVSDKDPVKLPSFIEKAEVLLGCPTRWSEDEFAQAIFLVRSLTQFQSRSLESVRCSMKLVNRWLDDRIEGADIGQWQGIPYRVLNSMKAIGPVLAEDAVNLLKKFDSLQDAAQRPDSKAYGIVLSMLTNSTVTTDKWAIADEVFQRGLLRGGTSDARLWNTYLLVLSTLSITDANASSRAEEILKEMIRLKIANSISFAITLRALAKSGLPDRAQAVLERLIAIGNVEIREIMFNTCIDAFAKQGNGEKAEELLRTMISIGIPPSTFSFACAINAWTQSQHPRASEHAERLLVSMEDMECPVTAECYTPLILSWLKCEQPSAAGRAIKLIHTMELRGLQGKEEASPSHFTYTAAISALSLLPNQESVDKASNLLERMKDIAKSGRKGFVVSKVAYSNVLDLLARSKVPGTPERALVLLREMQASADAGNHDVAPDTAAYNSVITAFAQKGKVHQARALFDEMIDKCSRGDSGLAPDTRSYVALMHAYANWKSPEAYTHVVALLETIHAEHAKDNTKPSPNEFFYTCTMMAFSPSESQHVAVQAEAWVLKLQSDFKASYTIVKPDVKMLAAVLHLFVYCLNKSEAAVRATSLIEWAFEESLNGDEAMKPDTDCYNYLLLALVRSGADSMLVGVYGILRRMSTSKDENCKPNALSYKRLMTAIAFSREDNTPIQQLRTFRYLLNEHAKGSERLKPTPEHIRMVLLSCYHCRSTEREGACAVLEEVGRIVLSGEEWLLCTSVFQLYFQACYALRVENTRLINQLYSLSQRVNHSDRSVEEAYRKLFTIT